MFDIERAKSNGIDSGSIEVMKKMNDNSKRRESCKMHDFEWLAFDKYRCKNCGCEEQCEYVSGYNDALRHAREL